MPKIQCPECDNTIKVSANDERASVRCDECGHKIRMNYDADSPSNRSIGAAKKKKPSKRKSAEPNIWLSLLPIAIVVPVSLALLATGLFIPEGGPLAAGFGFLVALGSFIWASVLVFKEGNYISLDYLSSLGGLKWLVILGFLGFYILGYIILLVIAQVMTASNKPKRMGPWIFLQVYSLFPMIAGLILFGAVWGPASRPPVVAQPNPHIEAPKGAFPGIARPDLDKGKIPSTPRPDPGKAKTPNNPPSDLDKGNISPSPPAGPG